MNKKEFIGRVQENLRTEYDASTIDEIMKGIFNTIIEVVDDDEDDVVISGFGKFFFNATEPRSGRNPRNGEAVEVASKRQLKFKLSNTVKATMND